MKCCGRGNEEPNGKMSFEVITKIPNKLLSQKNIDFELCSEKQSLYVSCKWNSELHQSNLRRYYYDVQEIKSKPQIEFVSHIISGSRDMLHFISKEI